MRVANSRYCPAQSARQGLYANHMNPRFMNTAESGDEDLTLQIVLPISDVLKKAQKEAIIAELGNNLAAVSGYEITDTQYRESYGAGLPLEFIVLVVTTVDIAIKIVEALSKMRKWMSKQGTLESSPGIEVKVGKDNYSIKNCKTAEDVEKIIREIKRV